MGTKRRVLIGLFLAIVLLVVGALKAGVIYPVRAIASFDYQDRSFEISYLTLMMPRVCNFKNCFLFEWVPNRKWTPVSLPDGSLLVLYVRWPAPWEHNLETWHPYISRPVWFWFNNAKHPTVIIGGDGTPADIFAVAPFKIPPGNVTVERLGLTSFIDAVVSDRSFSKLDPISAAPWRGGPSFKWGVESGQLFTTIEIASLGSVGLDRIKKSNGWIIVEGGCRINFKTLSKGREWDRGAAQDFSDVPRTRGQQLLRDGDLWRHIANAPLQGSASIMYPAQMIIARVQ